MPAPEVSSTPAHGPSRTIYALFVGIDAYPPPLRPLNGCVNDVTRLLDLLEERVKGSNDRFEPKLLADAEATRQGIIDAWRSHLGQARPGDVALFYYSGHGSQENAPPEFWDFEPDHLNETLVCYDSRLPGGWDLAESYSVYAGLLPKGGVWLEPGQEAWATVQVGVRLRKTIDVYIPDEMFSDFLDALQAAGLPPEPLQLRDLLKLIVSTDEADATLMQQGDLPVTAVSPAMRSIPRLSTLNRLMARVHTRNIGLASAADEAFADWTTVDTGITVVRPAEAQVVA
jgi:hypothetical protein